MDEPDFLQELMRSEVPPPPPTLSRDVHQRLNRLLLATHLADLALRGLGFAVWHMLGPLVNFLCLTVTGKPWLATKPREPDR